MKILHLVSTNPITGLGHAAMRASALAREWQRQGHEVTTFFPSRQASLTRSNELGVLLSENPMKFPRSLTTKIITRGLPYQLRLFSKEFIRASINKLSQLGTYDIVVADELTMGGWWKEALRLCPHFIYVAHNFELDLYFQIHGKSALSKVNARFLRNLEKQTIENANLVFAFSETDREKLVLNYKRKDIQTTSAGISKRQILAPKEKRTGLLFVGALDYAPNLTGLKWFIENVFPKIKDKLPLTVAGRNPSEQIRQLCKANSIELVASPPEVESLRAKAKIEIVPLFEGGGTRGKIIEACAVGLCVVSTKLGAEGLGLRENEDYLLANSAEEWVTQLSRANLDEILWDRIRTAGWNFSENFLYEKVARDLIETIVQKLGPLRNSA